MTSFLESTENKEILIKRIMGLLNIFINAIYSRRAIASLALKELRKYDVRFRCPFFLYGPPTCKYPEKTISVSGASGYSRAANLDISRKAMGWIRRVHPIPLRCVAVHEYL